MCISVGVHVHRQEISNFVFWSVVEMHNVNVRFCYAQF